MMGQSKFNSNGHRKEIRGQSSCWLRDPTAHGRGRWMVKRRISSAHQIIGDERYVGNFVGAHIDRPPTGIIGPCVNKHSNKYACMREKFSCLQHATTKLNSGTRHVTDQNKMARRCIIPSQSENASTEEINAEGRCDWETQLNTSPLYSKRNHHAHTLVTNNRRYQCTGWTARDCTANNWCSRVGWIEIPKIIFT